jgi:DNA-binding LacI/PurR family transcriptional regulator
MPVPDPTTRRARTTLSDVARELGISKATVSKALNNREDVSLGTRLRVREKAEELGYRATQSNADFPDVAVVANTLDAMYTLQVLAGLSDECLVHGLAMAVATTGPVEGARVHPLSDRWLRLIASKGYWGLILITNEVPAPLARLATELGLPLVVIDPVQTVSPDVMTIGATNWNGALAATQHLIGLGHRRIAYVQGPDGSLPSDERYEGYLSALRQAGLRRDPTLVIGDDFSFDCGLTAGRDLLSRPADRRPTAIFCGSDATALGVIESAREAGLRVPDDLSVVGFDDTFLAVSSAPRLTAVRQPMHEMGAAAIRALVSLHSGVRPSAPMRLDTQLIVRDSTAPPRVE